MKWFRRLTTKWKGDVAPESISAACDAIITAAHAVERSAGIWAFKEVNAELTKAIRELTEEIRKSKP